MILLFKLKVKQRVGLGPDLSIGLVLDTDNLGESGIIGTVGAALGATVGISIGVALFFGEAEGTGFNLDLNAKFGSLSIYFDEKGDFNGIGVSIGVGLGVSRGAVTKSGTLPFIDLADYVSGAVEKAVESTPKPPLTPSIPSMPLD